MKLSTAIERMPLWYQGCLAICLEGSPGTGKTDANVALPARLSKLFGGRYGIVVLNGGNLDVSDATGYLIPVHHDGYSDSRFTRPWWWYTSEGEPLENYDGGIIFVDEEDKAPVEAKKVLGEGKLSGRLCSHNIPGFGKGTKGWRIWSAANRVEDRSGSTKNLDHLISRTRTIAVQNDVEGWTNWATAKGVTPLTISFANTNAEIVFSGKVPEKQGAWCNPRSLVQWDEYMQLVSGGNDLPTDPVALEEGHSFIGEAAMRQWVNTIRLEQEMPKFSTIIANPDKGYSDRMRSR